MRLWIGLALGAALLGTAGCNTVAGFGRDLTVVGGVMTDASNDAMRGSGNFNSGRAGSADRNCQQSGSGKGQTQACAPGG